MNHVSVCLANLHANRPICQGMAWFVALDCSLKSEMKMFFIHSSFKICVFFYTNRIIFEFVFTKRHTRWILIWMFLSGILVTITIWLIVSISAIIVCICSAKIKKTKHEQKLWTLAQIWITWTAHDCSCIVPVCEFACSISAFCRLMKFYCWFCFGILSVSPHFSCFATVVYISNK